MKKAMLIRVGNDHYCDADKIKSGLTFDFIPTEENWGKKELLDSIWYDMIKSRVSKTKSLAEIYPRLKKKRCHLDPYFPKYYTYKKFNKSTYCDPGIIKAEFLKTLNKGDLLVFFWGIKVNNKKQLFIIGYFYVEKIIDLDFCTRKKIKELRKKYFSAHLIRQSPEGVLVIGSNGKLLDKPIRLTQKIKKKSTIYIIKPKYKYLLGINEIQSSSIFIKVLVQKEFLKLKNLLKNKKD